MIIKFREERISKLEMGTTAGTQSEDE